MKETMAAAVLHAPGKISIEPVPLPKPGPGEVLVRVSRCGVCMTDVHAFEGRMPVVTPVVLGHEFSGTVEALGERSENYSYEESPCPVSTGDKVTVIPLVACGTCLECASGRPNLCSDFLSIGGAGATHDGAFAEHVRVPVRGLFKMPGGLSFRDAAMVEVAGCCLHGIDLTDVRSGQVAVLIGAGSVGLTMLECLKLRSPARIVVFEVRQDRRDMAMAHGADFALDPTTGDALVELTRLTGKPGADVVFEVVGSPRTVELALKVVRKGGKVNIFGVADIKATCTMSPFDVYFREITITGTFAVTTGSFRRALDLAAAGRIKFGHIITEEMPLSQLGKAFSMMKDGVGLKKQICIGDAYEV